MMGIDSNASARLAVESGPGITRTDNSLAPRPVDLAETGLGESFVSELVLKHLYRGGIMDLNRLTDRLALAGPVLQPVIAFLRNESYVEVLSATQGGGVRHALTDKGRRGALDALGKSGYVGPAPVTLEAYRRIVQFQSVQSVKVTRADAESAFGDVVASRNLIDRLGASVNSGRPLFLYGPAGTGKTYLGKRLVRMIQGDDILVPHALLVGDTAVQFYDPAVHRRVDPRETPGLMLREGHDPRFVRCRRPGVFTGGELTLDMLEVEYDAATRQYHVPQSLMANNGLYMIDDLGRQNMSPDALLNRWITPMEENRDFLAIGAGQRFEVPFDVILVFSTNLNPLELADEAFLRRLGHKISFHHARPEEYEEIWKRTCSELDIEFDRGLLGRVLRLYEAECRALLPCHPRDLLTSVMDRLEYESRARQERITMEHLQHAWDSYFVSLDQEQEQQPEIAQ